MSPRWATAAGGAQQLLAEHRAEAIWPFHETLEHRFPRLDTTEEADDQ
ncbi:MAG: hypothetical protein ACRDYD_14380 [Acidimicrobiales bacterium]